MCSKYIAEQLLQSRSREGAWIEINGLTRLRDEVYRRSREGAWIEIHACRQIF